MAYRTLLLAAAIASSLMGSPALLGAASSRAGMTYESLKDLPDFGGTWTPIAYPFEGTPAPVDVRVPRELKPEMAERNAETRKALVSGAPVERPYCTPPQFIGRLPMNAGGTLEFLFTPGRVTLSLESGLVRRFYLRDDMPAQALAESRAGTSIARWEGKTLVVETTGLSANAPLVLGVPIGANARVVERMSLSGPDILEVHTTTTAPDVLVAPMTSVNRYRRRPDRLFTEFNVCIEGDRAYDASQRRERFEATPPADLPPPPAN